MSGPTIPSEVGDVACMLAAEANGGPVYFIGIFFHDSGPGKVLGTPTFISNLAPTSMHQALEQVGAWVAMQNAPKVRQ